MYGIWPVVNVELKIINLKFCLDREINSKMIDGFLYPDKNVV